MNAPRPLAHNPAPTRRGVARFRRRRVTARQPASAGARAARATPAAAPADAAVTSAPTLHPAMHDRYPALVSHAHVHAEDDARAPSGGEIVQTWYEAGALPGRLRIDTDLASKSGTLFAHDSIFASLKRQARARRAGTERAARARLRRLSPADRAHRRATARPRLRSARASTTTTGRGRRCTSSARSAATRRRSSSGSSAIDLLFVRMLEHGRQGRVDIRFNKYEQAGEGWVATEVVQLVNGTRRLLEEYTDVRANVTLSDALFDPKQWTSVRHWSVPRSSRD